MSRSPLATGRELQGVPSSDRVATVDADDEIQRVLDALDDGDCRDILAATDDEALSANEIAATCDLPLSTTYRKVELLADAGLLDERTRVRRTGKHPSEYVRLVDDVLLSVRDGGTTMLLVRRRNVPEATSSEE